MASPLTASTNAHCSWLRPVGVAGPSALGMLRLNPFHSLCLREVDEKLTMITVIIVKISIIGKVELVIVLKNLPKIKWDKKWPENWGGFNCCLSNAWKQTFYVIVLGLPLHQGIPKVERFSERAPLYMGRGCESANLNQLKSNVKLPKFETWLTGQSILQTRGREILFGASDLPFIKTTTTAKLTFYPSMFHPWPGKNLVKMMMTI